MKSPKCYPKHCCQLNILFSPALHSLLATPALFSIKGLSHYSSAYKTLPPILLTIHVYSSDPSSNITTSRKPMQIYSFQVSYVLQI